MQSDIKRDGKEGKSFVRRGESCSRGKRRAHHDETDHGDNGHEDAWTFAKSECVELHKRLRGIEREEGIQIRNAEQEEDGGDESKHASSYRARDDSSTGNDTAIVNKLNCKKKRGESMVNSLRIFCLFSDMARGVKASHCARGEEAGEYPHQVSYMDSRAFTTHNDRSQFHPPGAPVPLSFICY